MTLPPSDVTIWARSLAFWKSPEIFLLGLQEERDLHSSHFLCISLRNLTYINQNFHFNRCTYLKFNIPSFKRNANPNSKCKMISMWNISLKPLAVKRKETHLSLFFPSGSNTLVHEQSIWYLYWQGEMCDFKTSSSSAVT